MARDKNRIGVHGTDEETKRDRAAFQEAGKKKCNITKEEFFASAIPIPVKVADTVEAISPKQFSTGSFGYHKSFRVTIMVGGKPVDFICNCGITAIGSKPGEEKSE